MQLLERAGARKRAHGDHQYLKSGPTLNESELETGTGKALHKSECCHAPSAQQLQQSLSAG